MINYVTINWKTTNTSFIKLAVQLRDMGIKNYKFMLTLYDKDLIGVDPYAPDLTPELQMKIIIECKRNKFYFLRELVRLKDQGSDVPMMYEAHVGNISLHFLRELNISTYQELPRQTGKSIGAVAEYAHGFLFSVNTTFGHFSYNNKMLTDNIERIVSMCDLLPPWMHFHRMEEKLNPNDPNAAPTYKMVPKSAAKKLEITNRLSNNVVTSKTPGLTEAQANTAGRGATMLNQWWDEPCDTHNIDIAADAAFPSFITASDNAKKKGIQHSIMFTSTPPDVDSKEGKYLFKFVKLESSRWFTEYLDYTKEELDAVLATNKKKFFYITYQWDEVGKSVEWLEAQLTTLSPRAIRKDIFLIWEKDIVGNPFTPEDLNLLETSIFMHGHYKQINMGDGLHVKVYCNKDDNGPFSFKEALAFMYTRRLIVASDVAGGTGGNRDSSTLVGIDPVTTDVIFTFKSNVLDTHKFAKFIKTFFTTYCPRSILAMERNSYGWGVLSELVDEETGIPNNILYVPLSEAQIKKGEFGSRGNTTAGIFTLKPMRDRLFKGILGSRVQQFTMLMRSEDIYNEICTLEEKNGRIDHKNGAHDDLLIAFAIGIYTISDLYEYVLRDYPDAGIRLELDDKKLHSDLIQIGESSMTPGVLYRILERRRNFESEFIEEEPVVRMNNVTPTTMTLNDLVNIISASGGDFSIDNKEKLSPEYMYKTGNKLNEQARVSSAKQLGMSSAEIMQLNALRSSLKNQSSVSFDENGNRIENTESNELLEAKKAQKKKTFMSFF